MMGTALALWCGAVVVGTEAPPLPVGVSSFGADAWGGAIYVYGGHCGQTHTYSRESSVGRFWRWDPQGENGWEELPGGPALQGLMLVPHKDGVIRLGGMESRNLPGEPADSHSIATVARYDAAAKAWKPLPELPDGRSSFGAAVLGDTLFVVGGWKMRGRGQASVWHDTAVSLDLSDPSAGWKPIPQPFQRRALSAAVSDGRLYVLGGLNDGAEAERTVDVYDPKGGTWSKGPSLPEGRATGFSPAAITANGRLYVSPSNGIVYRLSSDGSAWEEVAKLRQPRMVHRIVPVGAELFVLGGASGGGNATAVERIPLAE